MLPYAALGFIIAIGGINPTHNFVDYGELKQMTS